MEGLHDAVHVRAKESSAEEVKGITDVADGMTRDWLARVDVRILRIEPKTAIYTDLDILPVLRPRYQDLESAETVVQERLRTVDVTTWSDAELKTAHQRPEVSMRANACRSLVWRRSNTACFSSVQFISTVSIQELSGWQTKFAFE